jgi:hypothetical protein
MSTDEELRLDVVEFVLDRRRVSRNSQRQHLQSMRRVRDAGQQSSAYFLIHYRRLVSMVATCDRWLARNQP